MANASQPRSRFSKLKDFLANRGVLRKQVAYSVGDVSPRVAWMETNLSWISRCFCRDRYVYFVSPVQISRRDVYIIERVEKLAGRGWRKGSMPTDYSGLVDETRGFQITALSRSNRGQFGERSSLTIYGDWIQSSLTHVSQWRDSHKDRTPNPPPDNAPFAGAAIPEEVRRFDSEQAAYAYLENINGDKIPARIRHIAWVAIAVSTILWQWHDEIAGLFG